METADIHHWELILLFLMIMVASVTALARRFQIAYPIMLVIGGLFVSLIPNMPEVTLNPDVVFLVFLPPLLFAAAYHTSWRDFRSNIVAFHCWHLGWSDSQLRRWPLRPDGFCRASIIALVLSLARCWQALMRSRQLQLAGV